MNSIPRITLPCWTIWWASHSFSTDWTLAMSATLRTRQGVDAESGALGVSVAMKKSPLVAMCESPVVAN